MSYIPSAGAVVAGVDGGRHTGTVLRAAGLIAERHGAPVVVAHVLRPAAVVTPGHCEVEGQDVLDAVVEQIERATLAGLAESSAPCSVITRMGEPARELVRLARLTAARAVVIGQACSKSRFALGRVAGGVGGRLRRSLPTAVLLVPAAQPDTN